MRRCLIIQAKHPWHIEQTILHYWIMNCSLENVVVYFRIGADITINWSNSACLIMLASNSIKIINYCSLYGTVFSINNLCWPFVYKCTCYCTNCSKACHNRWSSATHIVHFRPLLYIIQTYSCVAHFHISNFFKGLV